MKELQVFNFNDALVRLSPARMASLMFPKSVDTEKSKSSMLYSGGATRVKKARVYTEEFKREKLELLENSGKSFMPFPENLGYRSGLSTIGSKRHGRRRQSLVRQRRRGRDSTTPQRAGAGDSGA